MESFLSDAVVASQVNGKGCGLVLSRAVFAGELLFVSKALAVAPAKGITAAILATLRKDGAPRRAFRALYCGGAAERDIDVAWFRHGCGDEGPGTMDAQHVRNVVRFNGHVVTDMMEDGSFGGGSGGGSGPSSQAADDLVGLWLLPSLLNHSCAPSVVSVPIDPETLACVAARDLEAGEELTDCYVSPLSRRVERRQELLEQKGFTCRCQRCSEEAKLLPDEEAAHFEESAGAAHSLSDANAFLSRVEELRVAVTEKLASKSQSSDLRNYLRASVLVADIMAVMVYESDECTLPEKGERGDNAAQQVCLCLEQVAPLSGPHNHFAEQRLRYCGRGSGRGPALAYLLTVWLLRRAAFECWKASNGTATLTPLTTTPPAECRRLIRLFAQALGLPAIDVLELEERYSAGFEALLAEVSLLTRLGSAERSLAAGEVQHRPAALPVLKLDEMD